MMLSSIPIWLAFCLPCLPLLLAMGLYVPGCRAWAVRLAPWAPLAAIPLLLLYDQTVDLPWLLLGTRVGLDTLSLPLLILAITAWTLAGWHARCHLSESGQHRFFLFWLLTWTGNLCVFITLDAASFYAAYAMMSFSAYGLVIFHQRAEDYRAGRIYLTMAILGEGLIIAGLLMLGHGLGNAPLETGTPGLESLEAGPWAVWLFLAGFAVKMGLIPLHMWLPLAHPQAPVAASAVLSGVILKAGLMGWLRFLPLEADGFYQAGYVLLGLGLLTAFVGVVLGLCQDRIKVLLAYSSISQMGLIGAILGAALVYPEAAAALIMVSVIFALHHGLAKTALFLSVDLIKRPSPALWALLCVPALALAGAPLTSGALVKVALKSNWPDGLAYLEPLLMLSSLATTLLMARFLSLAKAQSEAGTKSRLPWHWLLLLLAGLSLPWTVAAWLAPMPLDQPFHPSYLAETIGPILIGGIVAILAWRRWPEARRPRIPAGDLIALFPRTPNWPALNWRRPAVHLPKIHWQAASERLLSEPGPALLVWLGLLGLLFLLRGL